jgi:HD-GYP domain-containing protein (c-di-GMP phosphodiesterase class II)
VRPQRKTSLEPGDTLGRDLLHPLTAQILLPAGTVLTDSYIFKIELLRLTDVAIECLRPEEEAVPGDAEGDSAHLRTPMDFDLFSKAKNTIVRLEEMAKAFGTPREAKALDSFGTREMLSDLVQSMLNRLERVAPASYLDLRCHDYYLYAHPINTAMIALAIGLALKYDRTRLHSLGSAALLADLGKFRIPRQVLHKGGELSDEEKLMIRGHGRLGAEVVVGFNWVHGPIMYTIENHHERYDGSGYPRGLRGPQIGEEAMVVGLADAYDAMISDQPYRKRMDPAVAYRVIQSHSGKEWDPGLVWAFQRFVAPYPVNSMVKLNTGDEARVIGVRPNNLFKPIVQVGTQEFDLAADKERRIVSTIIPRRYYREKISLPVEVHVAGRAVITASMIDLSLNGLQLSDVREAVEVGTELDVTIPIPARRASLQIFGNVVWSKESGDKTFQMGVAFKQISATNKERLLEALWGASTGASLPNR